MLTHFIIGLLLATSVFLAFIEERLNDKQRLFILSGYALVMIILATTKSIEHTADAINYEAMFYHNENTLAEIATEPTFIYLSRLIIACGGTFTILLFVYAILSIPLKLKALTTITPYIFTALLIYIPVYFEIHDMIQIRTAVAAAFLLTAIITQCRKKYLLTVLLVICAILFHYSALAFVPMLIIGNRKMNKYMRITVAVLVPIGFAMYILKKDLFSLIPSALVYGKLDLYQKMSEKGEWQELAILYKNLYFMSKCAMLYACLFYYDYIVKRHQMAPLLINLFAASILFILTMSTIPVLAGRVSDLYGIIDCIVFTFILYLAEPKYLGRIAIALLGTYVFFYNMLLNEYFT